MTMEISDHPGVVTDVTTDAITELVKNHLHREEKEIYAAWRAGVNYLHVVEHIEPGSFMYHRKYIPHNYMKPPANHNARTYDLRDERMSPEARELLREHKP